MKKRDAQEKADTKDIVSQQYLNIIEKMQQWARQTNALIVGSTIYKEDNLYFNRLLAVYPDGTYQIYDKHNCFKKGCFSPGKERLIFSWKGFRFSPYICYDLRFPEWSKNQNEYDIAIYIANWPESRQRLGQPVRRACNRESSAYHCRELCRNRSGRYYLSGR